ncbi:zona pellucida sperm-binding protein 3-like [Pseudoliparis swirei]|uniref:zona pellucida sperm-binding protein 3-like n=1 Tax=Pseudoliparis swirei TaxID=2059687 RepID=UPI0024BDF837|nr:zona pellucida sperm-binding protein 3-like [Pseudoliparis swirei]
MKTLCFLVHLLVGLCFRSYSAFPPKNYTQHASIQSPQITGSSQHTLQAKDPSEKQEQVNTVRVTCHPDSLEIIIQADMFEVGAPVNGDELRLGVELNDYCRATSSSEDEYRILVGLVDCGTKQRMTEDTLVYTNVLIYSPVASPDGVVRMDEAVIPIECHYERKYSLSSYSLMPTWIPFMSTQAAEETLEFDLRIMTNDWLHRRGSNVFHLGEPISIEASVRVGHHTGLRVFVSSCVATLSPDVSSEPRYVFVENGCLVDSELPGSRSHFLPRTRDDKIHLTIDAFKFHNEHKVELYITCHLNAVVADDVEAPNKACSFVSGRWRSADGNDYLCGYCQSQEKPSSRGKFGPRGFEKPEEPEFVSSGLGTNTVWKQEARVGPMIVLPAKENSVPIPVEELPPGLNKIGRPSLFGSQWRSGINDIIDKGFLGSQSTPDEVVLQASEFKMNQDDDVGTDLEVEDAVKVSALLEKESLEVDLDSKGAAVDGMSTLDDIQAALMADIEFMFYKVKIQEEDADLRWLLWRPEGDLDGKVKEFRMKWCTETDNFKFQISVQYKPVTRSGILSTVS